MQESVNLKKTMPRSSSASTLERVAVHDGYRDRCGFQTGRMCEVALPEWAESAHRIERACEGFFGTCRGGGAFEEKQRGFAPAFRNIQRTIASFGAWKEPVEWGFVRARCAARGGDLICPHTLSRL